MEGDSGLGVDSDDISELVLTLVETAWGVDAIDGLGNRVLDTLLRLLVDSSPVRVMAKWKYYSQFLLTAVLVILEVIVISLLELELEAFVLVQA